MRLPSPSSLVKALKATPPLALLTLPLRLSAMVLALSLVFTLLTASKCERKIEFTQALNEICGDGLDNDENGKVDCADSFCLADCALELSVFPTFSTKADTQIIGGTHKRAASIAVNLAPNASGSGKATLSGNEWTFTARLLLEGRNDLTVTASDSAGLTKTVTTSITRTP